MLLADVATAPAHELRQALAAECGVELVADVGERDDVVALAAAHAPDVALVDARLGDELLAELARRSPDTVAVPLRRSPDGELLLDHETAVGILRRVSADSAREASDAANAFEISERVQRVLDGDGLAIVYQPIMDLASQHVVGFEALSRFSAEPRWSPDKWFADAASVGLGAELELAAIDQALAVLPELPPGGYLGVNASPETVLVPGFHARLDAVDRIERVVLEITENAPIGDYGELSEALSPHRRRGLRLAIDDTGAGFASLRHILRLDPDIIKLDRSITERIDRERPTRALAAALTGFAFETNVTVTAEGIETASQLGAMQALGVNTGQGYLLGRPAPPPLR